MKRIYQILTFTAITGLLTFSMANTADAQRGGGGNHGGGGGGGGFHGGGGGGGGFHGGGGGGFSGGGRPSGGGFQGGGNRGTQSFGGGNRTQSFNGGGNRTQSFNGGGNRVQSFNGGGNRGFAYGGNRGPVTRAYGNGGFRGGNGYYRPGVGGGFRGGFRAGISFNGGFYNHGGFYGRYYAPRLGFSLGILPYGYYPFYYGQDQYFYSGGYYYQHYNNQYTVVEPPVGAEVNELPSNAQAISIDGQQYYEANGVYYLPITRDDGSTGYQIAGKDGQLSTGAGQQGNYQGDNSNYQNQNYQNQNDQTYAPQSNQAVLQPGEVVQALPPDTRKVKIEGQVYHVDPAGTYYHEERDQNGQKVYRVTDINQN